MPEDKQQQQVQEPERPEAEPNGEAAAEPNGTAEDAEYWKLRSRSWERQFKELKAEAEGAAEAKQQAVDEAKRADDAQAALEEANRKVAAFEAAAKYGVDASLLMKMSGGAADMESNAEIIAESIKAAHRYPEVPDNGQQDVKANSIQTIESEKDPVKRVMMRAENISLYGQQ